MAHINQIVLGGNLCRDSRIVEFDNGNSALDFTVANNVFVGKGKDEHANFINCTVFGENRVKVLANRLKKGVPVVVSGELRQKRNGESYFYTINVDDLEFFPKHGNDES